MLQHGAALLLESCRKVHGPDKLARQRCGSRRRVPGRKAVAGAGCCAAAAAQLLDWAEAGLACCGPFFLTPERFALGTCHSQPAPEEGSPGFQAVWWSLEAGQSSNNSLVVPQRLGIGQNLAQLQLGSPVVVPKGPHRLDHYHPAVCCHPTSSRAVSSAAASAAPASTLLQRWHLCTASLQNTGGSKLPSVLLRGHFLSDTTAMTGFTGCCGCAALICSACADLAVCLSTDRFAEPAVFSTSYGAESASSCTIRPPP